MLSPVPRPAFLLGLAKKEKKEKKGKYFEN
jgi:hypothetical protein